MNVYKAIFSEDTKYVISSVEGEDEIFFSDKESLFVWSNLDLIKEYSLLKTINLIKKDKIIYFPIVSSIREFDKNKLFYSFLFIEDFCYQVQNWEMLEYVENTEFSLYKDSFWADKKLTHDEQNSVNIFLEKWFSTFYKKYVKFL